MHHLRRRVRRRELRYLRRGLLKPGSTGERRPSAALGDGAQRHRDQVYGNFAGHFHNGVHHTMDAGFELYLTDATWDDVNTVRLVEVRRDESSFRCAHELIVVP